MLIKNWVPNDLALDIWTKKYQFEDETFEEWLDRVSNGNDAIKERIRNKQFLFAGRILANRGLQHHGFNVTYSNCYVIEACKDNLESIHETEYRLARTFSYGGGAGTDIANLRPRGASVNNAARTSTGSVSFAKGFADKAEQIAQEGRRGAEIITTIDRHPDLEEFIEVKKDLDELNGANISIRITDDFIEAVKNDDTWQLYFECETGEVIEEEVSAKELMYKIAESNWEMGEPGFLYWDTISNWNLLSEDDEFEYAGINPCGN